MQLTFTLLSEADVREIQGWHYDGPYSVYDMSVDIDSVENLSEILDRRSPYYTARDEQGLLVGFFCFGTSAQPWDNPMPYLMGTDGIVDIGLGMRPDLTGKRLGLAFVNAGLDFARASFAPQGFRLFVLAFNKRAQRVYERAGFQQENVFLRRNAQGEVTFVEMRRPALEGK